MQAIEIAERHHLHKPVTEQPVYNLFERHRLSGEYERFYRDYGYGSTTWSPLASGLLSGKYSRASQRKPRHAQRLRLAQGTPHRQVQIGEGTGAGRDRKRTGMQGVAVVSGVVFEKSVREHGHHGSQPRGAGA
ncbi:MAG: aldo/keto reductase [Ignavibacteriales bacterium]|nr:aldo/keto reductase [Ignavibacteriales bacterium]